MDNYSYIKTKIEFQIAVIKELFKHSKIGKNEYDYSIKKLENQLNKITVNNQLIPMVLNVKI